MSLKEFFEKRTGQRILQALEAIPQELKRLADSSEPQATNPDPDRVLARWDAEPDDFFICKYKEDPWTFKHVRHEYSETFYFHRGDPCWHFTATVAGKSRNEIEWMSIYGDAGNDAFRSGQPMTLLAFARWIGHSHPHYLFSKSDTRREFDWTQGREDWEQYCKDRIADHIADEEEEILVGFKEQVEDVNDALNNCDFYTEQAFCEAIRDALFHDEFIEGFIEEALAESGWGMIYTPQAYARWRQARYFALWLEEREETHGTTHKI